MYAGYYQPYWISSDENKELEHYGVKGMKWGVQKKTEYHPDYSENLRKRDKSTYGDKGVQKINKYMKRGKKHSDAVDDYRVYKRNAAFYKNMGKVYLSNVAIRKLYGKNYESLLEKAAKKMAKGVAYIAKNASKRKNVKYKALFDNVVAYY